MYVPEAFRLDDRALLLKYAAAYPFATVITRDEDVEGSARAGSPLGVSHLPLLVDAGRGRLRGHLARANPQVAHLASGREVLAIFHGPHGYVSPSVYLDQPSVPTWNYVVVHARGPSRLVDEPGLLAILEDTVARFDSTGWRPEEDTPFMRNKLAAIAGFEIDVEHLEGKAKLSQNRSVADRARVVTWLEKGDDASRALAAVMRGSS